MKCPKCRADNRMAWKVPEGMYDRFICSCGKTYTRSESIMAEEERIEAAEREAQAIDESNRQLEIDMDPDESDYCSHEMIEDFYKDDPIQNGWVGADGLP